MKINITPGKSGAILMFTNDKKFILKTINKNESLLLQKNLEEYIKHIKLNPNTLLIKFLGKIK